MQRRGNMGDDVGQLMTKPEIASLLGVSIENIKAWSHYFAEWLDVCPRPVKRLHDQDDVRMFALINEINRQMGSDVTSCQRIPQMERMLWSCDQAVSIWHKRKAARKRPDVARWQIVGAGDECLKYDYEWLTPLRSSVANIADFGCWASDPAIRTCSEPYALLWTLDAAKVVVVDKKSEYIRNAQEWLNSTRGQYLFFNDYDLKFATGDITDTDLIERTDVLDEGVFELSYCDNVLYNVHSDPNKLRDAIDTMVRVVKPGGWVIAVEPQMGVQFEERPVPVNEPEDISRYFEAAGLTKFSLDDAPSHSYCYQKLEAGQYPLRPVLGTKRKQQILSIQE